MRGRIRHQAGFVSEVPVPSVYLLVYFGPTMLLFLSGAVYFLIFPGLFDPELTALNELAASSGNQGLPASNPLIVPVLILIATGPIVNIIPTMGEELGCPGCSRSGTEGGESDQRAPPPDLPAFRPAFPCGIMAARRL